MQATRRIGIGSSCSGILANLVNLMREIQYTLNFISLNSSACVLCVGKAGIEECDAGAQNSQ
jgi:hypothetical protein